MFGADRDQLRRQFLAAWRKHRDAQPLEPLEHMIAAVAVQHPEYHALLDRGEEILDKDYSPEMGETNPFLHMGLHIAVLEQVGADRPRGVREIYRQAVRKIGDAHQAEHRMIDCLAENLWAAQRAGVPPDEQTYLRALRRLAGER